MGADHTHRNTAVTLKIHIFGQGSWEVEYKPWSNAFRWSTMLVCPDCGRHWASLMFPPETLVVNQHIQPCGSILYLNMWGETDLRLLAVLPEQLLRREFELAIKEIENGLAA